MELSDIRLAKGSHNCCDEGMCVMEAYTCVYDLPFSDSDETVSPVLAAFLRSWNDSLDDKTRQKLIPYIPRIRDTAGDGKDDTRAWLCVDWLTRECAPAFMDLTPALEQHASALRSMPEIVDHASLQTVNPVLAAAWAAAWDAAWAAAWDAAWAAARDAARAAARDAARAAAWAAAWDAAWAAAWDAARDAAWDAARGAARAAARDAARAAAWAAAWAAARKTLAPVVTRLQDSAFRLLDRMCGLGAAQ